MTACDRSSYRVRKVTWAIERPSGETAGCAHADALSPPLASTLGVPATAPVPGSTGTRQASQLPPIDPVQTCDRPVFSHATPVAQRSRLASMSPLPSRRTAITRAPARNEMTRPSGDHAGAPWPPGPTSAMVVSGRGSPPAEDTIHSVEPSPAA